MRLSLDDFSALLNNLGLSYILKDGKLFFFDAKTEEKLHAYRVRDNELVNAKILLSGSPFFISPIYPGVDASIYEYYRINANLTDDCVIVYCISKVRKLADRLYEHSELRVGSNGEYSVKETKYTPVIRGSVEHHASGAITSSISYWISRYSEYGNAFSSVSVRKNKAIEYSYCHIPFMTSPTGEVTTSINPDINYKMEPSEAIRLIDSSAMFKSVMTVLSPDIAENYELSKKEILGEQR